MRREASGQTGGADGAPTGRASVTGAQDVSLPWVVGGTAGGGGRKLPSSLAGASGKGLPETSGPDLSPRADQGEGSVLSCMVGGRGVVPAHLPWLPTSQAAAGGVGSLSSRGLPLSVGHNLSLHPRHWLSHDPPLPFTSGETEAGKEASEPPTWPPVEQGPACPLLATSGIDPATFLARQAPAASNHPLLQYYHPTPPPRTSLALEHGDKSKLLTEGQPSPPRDPACPAAQGGSGASRSLPPGRTQPGSPASESPCGSLPGTQETRRGAELTCSPTPAVGAGREAPGWVGVDSGGQWPTFPGGICPQGAGPSPLPK